MLSGIKPGLHRYKNNRQIVGLAAWLVMLAGFVPGHCLAEKPQVVETLSTVVVNGVPLSEGELSREINRLAPVAQYHNLSKERWQAIRKQAIDNIVDKELFYREALHRGITWDEDWVEFTFEKTRGKYTVDDFTRSALNDEKVKNRLYEDLRRSYVISKLWQEGKQQSMPDQKEVEVHFNANREKFMSPRSVKVIELLVAMKPSATKPEWDKAKKKADSIYKMAKKKNSFAAYRKGQTDVKIAERIIHEGMQGYDIKSIDKLADGEISKPVFSLKGYILFKKIKSIPREAFSFAEVREQVKNDLLNRKYQRWFDSLRQELRDKSKIIIGAGPTYVGR